MKMIGLTISLPFLLYFSCFLTYFYRQDMTLRKKLMIFWIL